MRPTCSTAPGRDTSRRGRGQSMVMFAGPGGCMDNKRDIMKVLANCLGLRNEFSRPDRDNHLLIQPQNFRAGTRSCWIRCSFHRFYYCTVVFLRPNAQTLEFFSVHIPIEKLFFEHDSDTKPASCWESSLFGSKIHTMCTRKRFQNWRTGLGDATVQWWSRRFCLFSLCEFCSAEYRPLDLYRKYQPSEVEYQVNARGCFFRSIFSSNCRKITIVYEQITLFYWKCSLKGSK